MSSVTENAVETTCEETVDSSCSKSEKANHIVNKNVFWAAGSGLIVVPFIDIAAVTSVQVKMISELCEVYEVSFSKKLVRTTIASISSGFGSSYLAYGGVGAYAAASLSKIVPVVGTAFGVTAMSTFASALTYGVGKYFIRHFEKGGTLENVDTDEASSEVKDAAQGYVKKQAQKNKNVEKNLSNLNSKVDRLESKLTELIDKLSKK